MAHIKVSNNPHFGYISLYEITVCHRMENKMLQDTLLTNRHLASKTDFTITENRIKDCIQLYSYEFNILSLTNLATFFEFLSVPSF